MKQIFSALVALSLCGCFQTENSSAQDAGTYAGNVSENFLAAKAIFANNCVPCHSYQSLSEADFVTQGLVVIGDAQASRVYYRISGSAGAAGPKNMPQGSPISGANLDAIATWINSITP